MRKNDALVELVKIWKSYDLDQPGDILDALDETAQKIEDLTKAAYEKGVQIGEQNVINATIATGVDSTSDTNKDVNAPLTLDAKAGDSFQVEGHSA